MTRKQRKHPDDDRANREISSQKLTAADCTRIPPNTPATIARALARLLRAGDSLANAGAVLSVSTAYRDLNGELTGVLIADRATMDFAGHLMSPGVLLAEVGKRDFLEREIEGIDGELIRQAEAVRV